MHARSALFDLYGDHLLDHGAWAPISSTVTLMGSLGITPPAVRTAVSRMVREGWLEPVEREARGYAATPAARLRLQSAHARIYRTEPNGWDRRWHVVTVPRLPHRSARSRMARSLEYLGYGQLAPDTWVAPRPSPELGSALTAAGVPEVFNSFHATFDGHGWDLAQKVWDLPALAAAYRSFEDLAGGSGLPEDPQEAFAARSQLVHEWRKFLFTDPGLPAEVLPRDWAGTRAAAVFDSHQRALMPPASAWVAQCLHWGL